MKPSLNVRLSAHLTLTPQLQQSIRLLQMSTLELQQEVQQMLEENPFLDAVPEGEGDGEGEGETHGGPDEAAMATGDAFGDSALGGRNDGEGPSAEAGANADFATSEFPHTPTDDRAEEGALADWDAGPSDWSAEDGGSVDATGFDAASDWGVPAQGSSADDDDETPAHERSSALPSLAEHLREQLLGMRLSGEDAAAVQALIDSLDDNGYLEESIERIADGLADGLGADDPDDFEALLVRLRCALRWLQSMDPLGVGARDLAECLQLQLQSLPPSDSRELALRLVTLHLDVLAKRDWKRLAQLTGAKPEALRAAHALIIACDPKPGRPFAATQSPAVVPDVIVSRHGRGWRVALNPEVMPRLRVSSAYAQAIRGQRGSPALAARLQEARWFMRNVQQRFDTILRVSQAIAERQRHFFSHGEIAMRPLVLREIADELGLHESTISRVTNSKYMATPYGTFELKYFFGSSLATDAGGNASSTAVRALIKQLVAAERPEAPLSDSQIAHLLEQQGIQVARRTVAKYREGMKIAPANLRKA